MIKNCLKQKIEVCIGGDYLREITFFQNFSFDQPRQHIKNQRHYFANKSPSSQSYGLFTSYVWMRQLDYKES